MQLKIGSFTLGASTLLVQLITLASLCLALINHDGYL